MRPLIGGEGQVGVDGSAVWVSVNKLSRVGPALGKQNSTKVQGTDTANGLCTPSASGPSVG